MQCAVALLVLTPHLRIELIFSARQAKALQASLMEIVDRVEVVKNEHEKLEGGNKFLQSYVHPIFDYLSRD
jgi:hypothetical protein